MLTLILIATVYWPRQWKARNNMAWLFESAQSDAMFQQMRRQKEEELYYKKNKVQSQEMQMYTQWQSEPMPWDNNKMAPKPWYNNKPR